MPASIQDAGDAAGRPGVQPAQTQVPQRYTCPPEYVVSMGPAGAPACVPMQPTTPPPDSPFFTAADAWGMRIAFDLQLALHRYVTLGVTPLSFSVMNSQAIGSSYAWEPGIWLGAAL